MWEEAFQQGEREILQTNKIEWSNSHKLLKTVNAKSLNACVFVKPTVK